MKPFFETDNHFENPFFIATVVDNNDPTLNYRVKVRINILHDSIRSDEELPWAAKLDSSFMGMDGTHSLHSVPEVGSKVLVITVANDPNSLLYMGCLYKKSDSTPNGNDYLNSYGIYNKDGEYIKLDKIQKLLELVWTGKININKINEMNITVTGNVNLTAPLTKVEGNVDITGTLHVKDKVTMDDTLDVSKAVTMSNTLNVTGLVQGNADIRAGGGSVGILTHTHPGVFPGPSSTSTGVG